MMVKKLTTRKGMRGRRHDGEEASTKDGMRGRRS
jgi:hypothetical protein